MNCYGEAEGPYVCKVYVIQADTDSSASTQIVAGVSNVGYGGTCD